MATVEVEGASLSYDLSGSGPPLLLVHASWGDRREWELLTPLLQDDFQIVTYDRRGHAQSRSAKGGGSIHEDVADAAALLGHLELGPAHVFAASYPACIVLRLAAMHPDAVGSVWVHEPVLWDLLEGDEAAQSALEAEQAIGDPVIEKLRQGELEAGARLFVNNAIFGSDVWDGLPAEFQGRFIENALNWLEETEDPDSSRLDAETVAALPPFLLSDGDQSRDSFRLVVDRLAALTDQAHHRSLEGASHFPHASHPQLVADTIREIAADPPG